jgi:RNA polymerase sigma factor (sigma-70 family)
MQPPVRDAGHGLGDLRARLVEIARRRVPREVVEDVVQEALAVIHEKGARFGPDGSPGPVRPGPPLPWCFQVLRNVIGNYYQKQRTRERALQPDSMENAHILEELAGREAPTPLESLERIELSQLLEDSIRELAARDAECGRLLRAALGRAEPRGESDPHAHGGPRTEENPRASSSTEYVRAFRCRQRLKGILLRKGYMA